MRLAFGVSWYRLREYVAKYADKVKELLEQDVYPLFTVFKHLSVKVCISDLIEFMAKYMLLPNDALIAATCRAYNIEYIATFDENFRRIPWLKTIP